MELAYKLKQEARAFREWGDLQMRIENQLSRGQTSADILASDELLPLVAAFRRRLRETLELRQNENSKLLI